MGRVDNRYVWQGGQTENQGGQTKKFFRRFAPNFAHPGLKPCRRPWRGYWLYRNKNSAIVFVSLQSCATSRRSCCVFATVQGLFAPWYFRFRSLERKFPGTFVPGNFRSRERMFPGTFVPRSDDTRERTVQVTTNYT